MKALKKVKYPMNLCNLDNCFYFKTSKTLQSIWNQSRLVTSEECYKWKVRMKKFRILKIPVWVRMNTLLNLFWKFLNSLISRSSSMQLFRRCQMKKNQKNTRKIRRICVYLLVQKADQILCINTSRILISRIYSQLVLQVINQASKIL